MIYHLYQLTFPNERVYLGITYRFARRMREHKDCALKGKKTRLYKAIRRYGWESISKRIIATGAPDYIRSLEERAIATFNSFGSGGYNGNIGGTLSPMLLKEVSEKVAASNRGRKLSEEHKLQISISSTGRAHTKETKAKIGAIHRGKDVSAITREKISNAHKGRKASDETRSKLSILRKRRVLSASTCEKLSRSLRAVMGTEEYKAKRSVASKAMQTPEMSAKKSNSVKTAYADPIVKERHRVAMVEAWKRRKSKQI